MSANIQWWQCDMAFKDYTLPKNELIRHLQPTIPPLVSDAAAHHAMGCGSYMYTRLARVPIESGMVPAKELLFSCLWDYQKKKILKSNEHDKMKEHTYGNRWIIIAGRWMKLISRTIVIEWVHHHHHESFHKSFHEESNSLACHLSQSCFLFPYEKWW